MPTEGAKTGLIWQFKKRAQGLSGYFNKDKVCLLRDPHIESLPVGFSGFPVHRRALHQTLQKLSSFIIHMGTRQLMIWVVITAWGIKGMTE